MNGKRGKSENRVWLFQSLRKLEIFSCCVQWVFTFEIHGRVVSKLLNLTRITWAHVGLDLVRIATDIDRWTHIYTYTERERERERERAVDISGIRLVRHLERRQSITEADVNLAPIIRCRGVSRILTCRRLDSSHAFTDGFATSSPTRSPNRFSLVPSPSLSLSLSLWFSV